MVHMADNRRLTSRHSGARPPKQSLPTPLKVATIVEKRILVQMVFESCLGSNSKVSYKKGANLGLYLVAYAI